jgi:hypothetical protein
MSGAGSIDFDTLFAGSDQLGEEVANLWMEWDSARQVVKDRWEETTQFMYATSTRETVNGNVGGLDFQGEVTGDEEDEGNGFNHSTHIPKLTEIADNLSATYMRATMPHENFFTYHGRDQDAVKRTVRDRVEAYLKAKHRSNGIRNVYQRLVDDLVLYGNVFSEVDFVSKKVDGDVGGESFSHAYVGPIVRRISPYDIVFNPLADDFESAPKIVRSIKTLGELHRDVEDSADGEYANDILNAAMNMRTELQQMNAEDFDKNSQLQYDGFGTPSQYFKSGYVEILNLYGDIYDKNEKRFYRNHVITVIDRKYVIRKKALNTYTGKPLIYHSGWRGRPDNLWAMGPLDNLVGMQYMVNHLENARADAFDQMLVPTRVEVGDVENDGVTAGRPGGRYIIATGEGSVSNLSPDTTVLNADFQIDRKMNEMERFAGLPSEQAGFRTPGEKTFGEVAMLDRHASKVFKNKIIQLEHMLESILNAELEVAKANPDFNDLIDVLGEDGVVEFIEITRADLKSNGKLVPIGARYYDRRQQLVQNFQLLQQGLSQDPMAMQHLPSITVAKIYAELMDMAEVVEPYARVGEEAQLARLQQAAQTQLQSENEVDIGGEPVGPEEQDDGVPIATP